MSSDTARLVRLTGFCLFILAILVPGLAPSTRAMALLGMATVLCVAVVYELSVRQAPPQWLMFAIILILGAAAIAYGVLNRFFPTEQMLHGPLIAADDPAPQTDCDGRNLSGDELLMLFGSDRIVGRGKGPFTPVRIGSCPALVIARKADGLTINAAGIDSDNDVAYRIQDNDFHLVVGEYLHGRRPDRSTLTVLNRYQEEIFYVRYLNRNVVRVRGRFRCEDARPTAIGEDAVTAEGRSGARPVCAAMTPGMPPPIRYGDPVPGR